MEYRLADVQDASLLAQMNKQLIDDEGHRNAMSISELEDRMAGWLAGSYSAFLFMEGGVAIGYALFRKEPEHIYLRQFFVVRERRRLGIGRAALTWLRGHPWSGVGAIRLDVLVGNENAIGFWRSVGFQDYCLMMEMKESSESNRASG